MDRLMRTAAAGAIAAALLTAAGCQDRSKSVLDRDEGTIEETREAVDRKAKDLEEESR